MVPWLTTTAIRPRSTPMRRREAEADELRQQIETATVLRLLIDEDVHGDIGNFALWPGLRTRPGVGPKVSPPSCASKRRPAVNASGTVFGSCHNGVLLTPLQGQTPIS